MKFKLVPPIESKQYLARKFSVAINIKLVTKLSSKQCEVPLIILKYFEKCHILQNNLESRIIMKLFFSPMQMNSYMKFVEIYFWIWTCISTYIKELNQIHTENFFKLDWYIKSLEISLFNDKISGQFIKNFIKSKMTLDS